MSWLLLLVLLLCPLMMIFMMKGHHHGNSEDGNTESSEQMESLKEVDKLEAELDMLRNQNESLQRKIEERQ